LKNDLPPQELSCIEKYKIMKKIILKSLGKKPGDFTLNLLLHSGLLNALFYHY